MARRSGWWFVGLTVVLWASAFPAIRVALRSFSPGSLSLLRAAVAAVALGIGGLSGRLRRPARRDLALIGLCGFAGIAAYQLLLNTGERHVTAGTASLLISTAPLWTLLISSQLHHEPLPRRRWLGLAVALVGSGVVAAAGGTGWSLGSGALVVLAAAVVQGVYHVTQRPLLARMTAYEAATWSMVAGAVMLLPLAPPAVDDLAHAHVGPVLAIAFLGIGPSAIGFVSWAAAIARLDVSRPALALYAVPVVAIFVAWVWLGEVPAALAVAGGAVSITGVVLGTRPARPNVARAEAIADLQPS